MKLRCGSICSGIEAATVAWHALGWQAAGYSEVDSFCCQVLKHHHPNTPNWGDMTLIADRILEGKIEAPEVLVGGTPCQAFSRAGLRRSLRGKRGQLTLAYAQIANAIDSRRHAIGQGPCIIVWENVPGVLSAKDKAFGHFLAALVGKSEPLKPPDGEEWPFAGAVRGSRRVGVWRVLDAQYFGVPQQRRRLFVVSSAAADAGRLAEILLERAGGDGLLPERKAETGKLPCFKRCDGGISLERLSHLVFTNGTFRKLTPIEWERCFGFPDDYTLTSGASDGSRYNSLGNSMAIPVMRWVGERVAKYVQETSVRREKA
jgi:DNA (cytosine-5)-methyltransferase 1